MKAAANRQRQKSPAATQMGINAIVDGQSISVTGTYNDDKDHVLEAMKVLVKTGAVS